MSSIERASHHRRTLVDELLEVGAAELMVQRGLHDAEKFADADLRGGGSGHAS